uniref:PRE_C2HC domain-containing protein n=1 Tax=Heterorhabditis bacteriophora TaxID=37862 RepID=A0A1I7WI57_HETBA
MTLCIVGTESLDQMETYMNTLGFDAIENKEIIRKEWIESPYGAEQLGKRIEVVPIKDTRSLKITFPIPDLRHEYRSAPSHYLCNIIYLFVVILIITFLFLWFKVVLMLFI